MWIAFNCCCCVTSDSNINCAGAITGCQQVKQQAAAATAAAATAAATATAPSGPGQQSVCVQQRERERVRERVRPHLLVRKSRHECVWRPHISSNNNSNNNNIHMDSWRHFALVFYIFFSNCLLLGVLVAVARRLLIIMLNFYRVGIKETHGNSNSDSNNNNFRHLKQTALGWS